MKAVPLNWPHLFNQRLTCCWASLRRSSAGPPNFLAPKMQGTTSCQCAACSNRTLRRTLWLRACLECQLAHTTVGSGLGWARVEAAGGVQAHVWHGSCCVVVVVCLCVGGGLLAGLLAGLQPASQVGCSTHTGPPSALGARHLEPAPGPDPAWPPRPPCRR